MRELADEAAVRPPEQAEQPDYLHFEFTGSAGEFFRIWIVNVLLSILTLGIYSAWAKVRTKKYFYRHTWLDETSFDYHADPRRILVGRVIIGSFFAALFISQYYSPVVYGALLVVLFLVSPWIVIKALSFNARNSSYRNVRFGFTGTLSEAFLVQVALPLACLLSLGLLTPYADWRFRKFTAENHRYGTTAFTFRAVALDFFWMYLRAIALSLACIVGVMFAVILVALATGAVQDSDSPPDVVAYFGAIAVCVSLLVPGAYMRAASFNLFYGHLALDNHRFRSHQSAMALFWIYLSNLVAILSSLGFLVPWAKVRLARYRARCLALVPAGSLTFLADREQQEQSALGEAAFDFGDFDFGL